MSLKKILSEAFSGGRPVPRGTLGSLVDELKRLAGGSRRAASRASGVSESTLRGWDKGTRPRNPAAAVRKVRDGLRRLMRTDPGTTVIATIGNAGKGPATRTVPVNAAAMKRAGDAWERGDLGGMVREFRAGITDDWYRKKLFRLQPGDDEPDYDDDDYGEGGPGSGIGDQETSEPYAGGVTW